MGKLTMVASARVRAHRSRENDKRYPWQSRESVRTFNSELARRVHAVLPKAIVLDTLALATEAQTSDGLHFLTDVNLARAAILLRALNVSSKTGQTRAIVTKSKMHVNTTCVWRT